jgi:HEAT repeat protein
MNKMGEEIIERLINDDVVIRLGAKYQFIGKGEAAIPVLLTILEEDEREVVRYWVYDIFGGLGPHARKVVPMVLKSLREDDSERVRAISAGVLLEIVENFEDIISILLIAKNKDKSDQVQRTLDMVLYKIAGKLGYASIEVLTKAFE